MFFSLVLIKKRSISIFYLKRVDNRNCFDGYFLFFINMI